MAAAPRRILQPLRVREEGAFLHATYWGHIKAALASAVPFAILYFAAQPLDEAMGFLQSGGMTLAPSLLAIYACAWAGGSMLLLRWRRFDDSLVRHLALWAAAAAVALPLVAFGLLALVRAAMQGTWDFWNASTFVLLAAWTPVLGAAGGALGRWALQPSLRWHRWLEREPLPDALTFVEGKRDRDDFSRM